KQLAIQAGVPGASSIPDRSQLMMGFTSTQQAALGPGNIASFETLGLTDVKPGDYFASGAAMHLSHIYEDLSVWYGKGFSERTRQNAPGMHFVVFVPTSKRFHLARRSMDGILPDGTQLKVAPRDAGINGMLHATHPQNFLVPPRTHRSFPMAELLS